jgi:hypothetical protein
MIVVPLTDFQFSLKALSNKFFKLSLLKYMIVSMIYSRLLILITYCSLYKATLTPTLLRLFLQLLLFLHFLLCLLILILKMPCDKHILRLEHLILLLVGPDVDEDAAAHSQNTVELADGRESERLRGEVVHHRDRDH